MLPEYQLYALRYANREARRADHFIGGDPHDGPMPMDYFVWVATSPTRTFLIDTGFPAEVAARRNRAIIRCPIASLTLLSIDPNTIQDVILTHLHYDHVGNFGLLPAATFHLQESELHFAVGRYMKYQQLRAAYEIDDVVSVVRANYQGRVRFYNAEAELAPGLTIHPAPGHTAGLQFVRVHTARGWVVIASDVTHFYENMEAERPFTIAFHVGGMLEGFDALKAAAPTPNHIIPGHDPKVMQRYPAPTPELQGIVVQLHLPPLFEEATGGG